MLGDNEYADHIQTIGYKDEVCLAEQLCMSTSEGWAQQEYTLTNVKNSFYAPVPVTVLEA